MLQVQDALTYRIVLTAFIMPIMMGGILIYFIYKFQRKKYDYILEKKDLLLREQTLIIEKQQAVESERNRIASEMHDDLGAGLTTIRYLSDRAMKYAASEEEQTQIAKISEHSKNLVSNMSEIIWAMNSRNDSMDNLLAYLRRYASEYLSEHAIKIHWTQNSGEQNMKLSGERRRNLFLVVKEALHNLVKHAHARELQVKSGFQQDCWFMELRNDGIQFMPNETHQTGNGLHNMQKRMEQIGGKLEWIPVDSGTALRISLHKNRFEA